MDDCTKIVQTGRIGKFTWAMPGCSLSSFYLPAKIVQTQRKTNSVWFCFGRALSSFFLENKTRKYFCRNQPAFQYLGPNGSPGHLRLKSPFFLARFP